MEKLCFITKSDRFDILISSLRKSGITTYKKATSDDLNLFDVLIVDLGYPLEMAYPFLEKIRKDFRYSDKLLIAAITHKSQLAKLRSIALGCDDYISPNIEYKNLLQKIQELKNPTKFLVKKAFPSKLAEIKFEASLTHISEKGCLIKSKVSINQENSNLNLKSKLFEDLNIDSSIRFSVSKSNPMAKRNFVTEVHFLNQTEEDRHKLRQMVHGWSAL